ncbi:MAG: hypothetical protein VST68_03740 [Nitrospirota bacterium]|nr:hypothetical protein [Nitrospirota bacterium]
MIGVLAYAGVLSLFFLDIPPEGSLIALGGAVFVGMQGLILFMVATSKEEVPAVPPPKRALLWYSAPDFLIAIGTLHLILLYPGL